ncbi:MAG: hypothetical protein FWE53_00635 [Firmicutes bacterium]|nr:hypothetical protein [Bacillota bacterium]
MSVFRRIAEYIPLAVAAAALALFFVFGGLSGIDIILYTAVLWLCPALLFIFAVYNKSMFETPRFIIYLVGGILTAVFVITMYVIHAISADILADLWWHIANMLLFFVSGPIAMIIMAVRDTETKKALPLAIFIPPIAVFVLLGYLLMLAGVIAGSSGSNTKSGGSRSVSPASGTGGATNVGDDAVCIEKAGLLHQYLILKDGRRIQLYDYNGATGMATDYHGNKYSGLSKTPIRE